MLRKKKVDGKKERSWSAGERKREKARLVWATEIFTEVSTAAGLRHQRPQPTPTRQLAQDFDTLTQLRQTTYASGTSGRKAERLKMEIYCTFQSISAYSRYDDSRYLYAGGKKEPKRTP